MLVWLREVNQGRFRRSAFNHRTGVRVRLAVRDDAGIRSEHRPDDCDVLVVLDKHRNEDPYELAGEVQFIESSGQIGFAASVNAGIQASCAEVVHVLAAGVEVCEGWADVAMTHFRDLRVAAVSPIVTTRSNRAERSQPGIDYPPRRGL